MLLVRNKKEIFLPIYLHVILLLTQFVAEVQPPSLTVQQENASIEKPEHLELSIFAWMAIKHMKSQHQQVRSAKNILPLFQDSTEPLLEILQVQHLQSATIFYFSNDETSRNLFTMPTDAKGEGRQLLL